MPKTRGPLTVETGGKLYLYTEFAVKDYELTQGHFTRYPPPGRPLSKAECIRLARTLLNAAAR